MENTQNRVQWQPMIEMVIVLITILGSTIPLYLHTDSKVHSTIQAMRQDAKEFNDAIRQDMRDFHGRLERQDAEFKAHIVHYHQNQESRK